jgi:hypothetical protein
MADGDICHNRLALLYQKPYKWLCEGKASSDECTKLTMRALKKDLKIKGDLPVLLAQRMGERVSQIIGGDSESNTTNWTALNKDLERLAQQADGAPYLKELVLRAAKVVLHDLRYERDIHADNTSEAILWHYMTAVYESGFQERIPLTSEHHAGVDETTLATRIGQMEPDIHAVISAWAKKANTDGNLGSLRLPPRRQVKNVDLNEDLLAS